MRSLSSTNISLMVGFVALMVLGGEMIVLKNRTDRTVAPLADENAAGRPSVLFVFRPSDCPQALAEIDLLNAVWQKDSVHVSGVMLSTIRDDQVVREIIQSYKIRFPVRVAKLTDLSIRLASLGNPALPLSIVLDEKGRIRTIVPARTEETSPAVAGIISYLSE
jgi:peroxiredoxin